MAVTDNFNRADGGLGANWTTAGGFSPLSVVSNACKGTFSGQHHVAFYTGAGTAPADQYAQFKVTTTGGFIGPVLRGDGTNTFYTCYYNAGTATIYKWIGASATQIGSGSTITPAVNDVVYLEAVGTALTMKVNGATVCTATDSSITGAGYTGIDLYDNVAVVDDFEGGSTAVDVNVSLTGVAASPAIGSGTVTGVILNDGDTVSPWTDVSGNAHDGVIVGTPAPTLRTNVLNTKPVVRFKPNEGRVRGDTGILSSGLPAPGYNYTIICVSRMVGPTVGRIFAGLYPTTNFLVGFHSSGQDCCYDGSGFIAPALAYGTLPTPWKIHSMTGFHSGVTAADVFYKDGVSLGSGTGGGGLQGNYNLSGYAGPSAEETCDCEVAELLVYNHELTTTDRANVEKGLADKYGLSVAGGTAVDPATVSGLQVWLRADSLVGDVSVFLAGVGANPQVGTGTVTISSEVVTPPLQGAPGAYWDWWPKAEEKVYLTGVAANPQIGNGTVYALQSADEIVARYPFPQVEVQREPRRIPPLVVREPAKPPPPPPMVFVHLVGWQPMSAIGTGTIRLSYQIDEDEMLVLAAMMSDL